MTSPLRSFLQFGPLERKLRQVAEKSPDWKELTKSLAGQPLIEYERAKTRRWNDPPDDQVLAACLESVTAPGGSAGATPADLLHFHELLQAGERTEFRQGAGSKVAEGHVCLDPSAVPRALARFFEWTGSQAFAELHGLEQITLCQVRLYEIWPFDTYSELTADFFSLRALYLKTSLLPLFAVEDISRFQEAVSEAFGFVTKPLVDFYLKACERTLDRILGQL